VLEKQRRQLPDNYRCWTLLEALYLVFSVVAGSFVVFLRIGSAMFFSATNFSRLDISLLPSGFESFDAGFRAFYAVVLLDHRLNNPIARTFVLLARRDIDSIDDDASVRRRRRRRCINDDETDTKNEIEHQSLIKHDELKSVVVEKNITLDMQIIQGTTVRPTKKKNH
jgi:hypothetical protein